MKTEDDRWNNRYLKQYYIYNVTYKNAKISIELKKCHNREISRMKNIKYKYTFYFCLKFAINKI